MVLEPAEMTVGGVAVGYSGGYVSYREKDGMIGRLDPERSAMRVVLRPLGSPLPLGAFALVPGGVLLSGFQLGWFAQSEAHSVAILVLAFTFPLQALASVLAFLSRDALVGTGFGVFSGVWLSFGVNELVRKPGVTSAVLGVFLLSCAALLAMLMTGGFAGGKAGAGAVILAGSTRFLLSGLYELTSTTGLERAAGVVGLVFVAVAAYVGVASLLEDSMHRSVLPLGRRGLARAAFDEGLHAQIGDLQQEAGVRNQL
jgi:succinate-acetate transporter protein